MYGYFGIQAEDYYLFSSTFSDYIETPIYQYGDGTWRIRNSDGDVYFTNSYPLADRFPANNWQRGPFFDTNCTTYSAVPVFVAAVFLTPTPTPTNTRTPNITPTNTPTPTKTPIAWQACFTLSGAETLNPALSVLNGFYTGNSNDKPYGYSNPTVGRVFWNELNLGWEIYYDDVNSPYYGTNYYIMGGTNNYVPPFTGWRTAFEPYDIEAPVLITNYGNCNILASINNQDLIASINGDTLVQI